MPRPKGARKILVTIRVDPKHLDEINAYCRRNGIDRSNLLRLAALQMIRRPVTEYDAASA